MSANPSDPVDPVQMSASLTKRELFAAMAMQGICANSHLSSAIQQRVIANGAFDSNGAVASLAAGQADALIAELNRLEK